MRRSSRRWRLAGQIGVSLAIIVYILIDVDWGDLGRAIRNVHLPWVAAAVLVYLVAQLVSAAKWMLLGRAVGFDRTYGAYARNYYLGMFFNLFGPSTLGGDLARSLYLARGRRRAVALNSVVFDRVSGLAVLMAIAAIALLVTDHGLPAPLWVGVVLGGLMITTGWWICPRLVPLFPVGSRIRRLVEHDLAPFFQDRRLLARVSVVSACFHVAQVGQQWLLARAVGIDLPLSYCLAMHPILAVMMALPVSISGFGVREGGYLYFLTRIGIDDSFAVTMGLAWWVVSLAGGLVGGVVFLANRARLPRIRPRPASAAVATVTSELQRVGRRPA